MTATRSKSCRSISVILQDCAKQLEKVKIISVKMTPTKSLSTELHRNLSVMNKSFGEFPLIFSEVLLFCTDFTLRLMSDQTISGERSSLSFAQNSFAFVLHTQER
jgi:hypothetical protein